MNKQIGGQAFNKLLNIWVGPNTGFEIKQLFTELKQCDMAPEASNLFIHGRAMVVEQRHKDAEAPSGGQSTEHISSTMSGAGAALTEKAMRRKDVLLAKDVLFKTYSPTEFVIATRQQMQRNNTFLHEVSQGWALSLNHGTHYPTCTSRDCTPQQAWADFGVTKDLIGDVYLNVRSFPIRVGNNFRDGKQTGYSGDCLSDQRETSWEEIGKNADMPQDEINKLSINEMTTVTKKLRRCFTPSWLLLQESAIFCGATKLILNFPQYIHWSCYKARGGQEMIENLHPSIRGYIDKMQEVTNLPVVMLGTGADHDDYIYLD